MTTFTTEDRELAEKENNHVPGYCYLTNPSTKDKIGSAHPIIEKIPLEYRIVDASEDSED
jgi:hypothetical protein